ncbi:MAG: TonB-dependent receptor [Bdellovibrionales bacterium]|nr:TonB-dependent receptor [Bdellovibrionales bacterium]
MITNLGEALYRLRSATAHVYTNRLTMDAKKILQSLLSLSVVALGYSVPTTLAQDLDHYSIEDLIQLDVTSVSRRPEEFNKAAAAVTVITAEDIERSGLTTIWDVLRMVPGVHIARQGSNSPAVSIRGINSRQNSFLLVLQDGRPLYEPLFSGVFWSAQQVPLESIERIEVIRGPGATLWGENAVNGVVNIITKDASETQGLETRVGGGTYEKAFGSVRYGDTIGEDSYYRTWVKGYSRDDFESLRGESLNDAWWGVNGGFRIDSDLSDDDVLTVSGEVGQRRADNKVELDPIREAFAGDDLNRRSINDAQTMHVLGEWTRDLGEESHVKVLSYLEHNDLESSRLIMKRDTVGLDVQHRTPVGTANDIVWGGEYRYYEDEVVGSLIESLDPSNDEYSFVSLFGQDTVTVIDETLDITLGSRFSHNEFTDWEILPQARFAWYVDDVSTVWGAVARSVRIPGRSDQDVNFVVTGLPASEETFNLPVLVRLLGNNDLKSIDMISYEIGGRRLVADNLHVDVAGFFFDYSSFPSFESTGLEVVSTPAFTGVESFGEYQYNLSAQSAGGEIAIDYRPIESLRLVASYAYLHTNVFADRDTFDRCNGSPGAIPVFCLSGKQYAEHIVSFRPSLNLPYGVHLDAFLQYVPGYPAGVGEDAPEVDDYLILDVRAAYQVTDQLEVSVVGQNLVEDGHQEWLEGSGSTSNRGSLVPRGVYAMLTFDL